MARPEQKARGSTQLSEDHGNIASFCVRRIIKAHFEVLCTKNRMSAQNNRKTFFGGGRYNKDHLLALHMQKLHGHRMGHFTPKIDLHVLGIALLLMFYFRTQPCVLLLLVDI